MLEINMDDVRAVLELLTPHLVTIGIVLLLAIALSFFSRKFTRPKRFLVRTQSWITALIIIVIVLNLMLLGPLATMITLATNRQEIQDSTIEEAIELAEEITAEGIVMLENDESLLPLNGENTNINVFGWAASNPITGGSGSGSISDAYDTVTLIEGIENAGFNVNDDLISFYEEYTEERPAVELFEQDWTLPEPSVDSYPSELLEGAEDFSETAIIVLGRTGAEGVDLPSDVTQVEYDMDYNSDQYDDYQEGDHYLQLSQSERNMVEMVTESHDDVILLYNASNPFELGFVEEFEEIKSVLWVPGTGHNGFEALGSVLAGEINPSGRSTNTFVYDIEETPTFNNFGNFEYENTEELVADSDFTDGRVTFVNYVEGIYTGYRFFETAAAEGFIDYDEVVQYPFGYGLSYTNFEQEISDFQRSSDGEINVTIEVTNTGDTAGKESVQMYYTPPYTNGEIEKSDVNLMAFDKTDILEPGDTETITLSFTEEDMASFDTYGTGSWVLEEGQYTVSLRNNSNEVIDEEDVVIEETIVYDEDNPRDSDEEAASVQFDFAEGSLEYLSRADGFANYEEAIVSPANYEMDEETMATFYNDTNWDPADFEDPEAEMPVTGADNGGSLIEMRGLDYDDPAWEPLLDQLTADDMVDLIALGGYSTAQIPSVGKIQTIDLDGPAAINNNFTGQGTIGMPVQVMLANTFSPDLAREFGSMMGRMADEMGVTGWYAPGSNLHRTAFAGRNFEYYSEDPLLSGVMTAEVVEGAYEDFGVYSYVKHFALNDQEENRWRMLNTWSNEQAIREIYLPPFEMAVKDGGATAMMSAYNWIGTEWAGSSDELLNTVLRDEWGFEGMVITDYFAGFGFMDADRMIRNGGDLALISFDNSGNYLDDTSSATALHHMRRASKNIMYTTVNSRAYAEGNVDEAITLDIEDGSNASVAFTDGLFEWQIALIAINVVLLIGVIAAEVYVIKKYRGKKEETA